MLGRDAPQRMGILHCSVIFCMRIATSDYQVHCCSQTTSFEYPHYQNAKIDVSLDHIFSYSVIVRGLISIRAFPSCGRPILKITILMLHYPSYRYRESYSCTLPPPPRLPPPANPNNLSPSLSLSLFSLSFSVCTTLNVSPLNFNNIRLPYAFKMRQDYLSTSYLDQKYLPSERSETREI